MKILFITHDSSYTGAPIVFLHLINELISKYSVDGDILTLENGPLDEKFKNALTLIKEKPLSSFRKNYHRILRFAGIAEKNDEQLPKYDLAPTYDLIYCNSVVTAKIIPELKAKFNCPIILHVHELQISIEQFAGIEVFNKALPHVDVFIAASKAVSDNLIKLAITENKVKIVHESVPVIKKNINPLDQETLNIWKKNNYFIVGGSGTTDWRKGTDLFLYTAKKLSKTEPNIRFIWVGGYIHSVEYKRIQYEVRKLGIEHLIYFTGPVTNPNDYYDLFDLFFLTSREDPFPLVCLENALLSKPVLCFEGSGGIPELVKEFSDCLIPFGSIEDSCNRIIMFKENDNKRKLIGESLKLKVENEFNIGKMAEKVMAILKKEMK